MTGFYVLYVVIVFGSECVLPHLNNPRDKINLLVSMTRRLFVFASGGCCEESPDSPANQEVRNSNHANVYLYRRVC